MLTIFKFVLNPKTHSLNIHYTENSKNIESIIVLTYEYLRIFSPAEISKANAKKSEFITPTVFHKKEVKLLAIEPLAKHGHRLIFDDEYEDIFSDTALLNLATQFEHYWPQYLNNLTSVNNREASIQFTPVK